MPHLLSTAYFSMACLFALVGLDYAVFQKK